MVQGKHWPVGEPFVGGEPGDFQFSDEGYDKEGTPPKWFRFVCPLAAGPLKHRQCSIPIKPQTTSKGNGWKWDGNREAPTFTPSINCLTHNPEKPEEKYGSCGWHGYVTKGKFVLP